MNKNKQDKKERKVKSHGWKKCDAKFVAKIYKRFYRWQIPQKGKLLKAMSSNSWKKKP